MFSNNTASNLYIQEYFKRLIPAGSILSYAGTEIPRGWKNCNGSELKRDLYPELFKAIGTIYGPGDGSTTFNLPNFKGRVPVCRDLSQTEFNTMGETGGEKKHTLTIDEMPSHDHGGTTSTNGEHTHTYTDGHHVGTQNIAAAGGGGLTAADEPYVVDTNTTASSGSHNHSISSQGGGQAHNVLNPYIVVNYIIKCY